MHAYTAMKRASLEKTFERNRASLEKVHGFLRRHLLLIPGLLALFFVSAHYRTPSHRRLVELKEGQSLTHSELAEKGCVFLGALQKRMPGVSMFDDAMRYFPYYYDPHTCMIWRCESHAVDFSISRTRTGLLRMISFTMITAAVINFSLNFRHQYQSTTEGGRTSPQSGAGKKSASGAVRT